MNYGRICIKDFCVSHVRHQYGSDYASSQLQLVRSLSHTRTHHQQEVVASPSSSSAIVRHASPAQVHDTALRVPAITHAAASLVESVTAYAQDLTFQSHATVSVSSDRSGASLRNDIYGHPVRQGDWAVEDVEITYMPTAQELSHSLQNSSAACAQACR